MLAGAEVIRRRSHSDYDSGGIYYRTVAPTPAYASAQKSRARMDTMPMLAIKMAIMTGRYFPPCIPKASVPHFVDGVISTGSVRIGHAYIAPCTEIYV